MYIKKMHILIEQKLQNIGVFAYQDFLKEEVDLQIDTAVIKLIEDAFTSDGKNKTKFEDNQKNKDKFKELEKRNTILSFDKLDNEYIADLPSDYNHRISDSSNILYQCSTKKIQLGEIKEGKFYLVVSGTVSYESKAYKEKEYFKGVLNSNTYGYEGAPPVIYQLEESRVPNINTELEYYERIKNNALTTSSLKGLVSTISGKNLIVFCPDFFLDKIFITYIKEPKNANFNFTTFTSANTLEVGSEYEVVKGNIIYKGNTISYSGFNELKSFKVVSGFTTFTGSGIVRLKGDGDIELNNTTSYYIIDETVKALQIASEQNQQKILNTAQNGIPS